MAVGIVYDPMYLQHQTGSHVESPERLVATMDLIKSENMLESPDFKLIAPRPATIEEIKMIHHADMIEYARAKSLQATGRSLEYLDGGDTVVCGKSFDVALLAAGGAMAAADAVLSGEVSSAFALVRPPGHHANASRSSGFCIFNNMAILVEYLLKKKGLKKVAIFDIDLHHGNGTSELFYGRNDVLFFSSHQDPRTQYPGTGFPSEIGEGPGKGYNMNAPLAPGAGDDVVQLIFSQVIKPVFEQYEPDIILCSFGGDAHYSDPLSGLSFTTQGYGHYVEGFKRIADKCCGGKMVLLLEGGYRVKILAQSIVNILNVLAGKKMPFVEAEHESGESILEYHGNLAKKLQEHLKPFWKF
ncbi:MAG: histone deacetylase [Candidatus Lokiarchaeota archaeon]|nr:histone deacetylase [Candidatus Lokiarchaeota archaeon]